MVIYTATMLSDNRCDIVLYDMWYNVCPSHTPSMLIVCLFVNSVMHHVVVFLEGLLSMSVRVRERFSVQNIERWWFVIQFSPLLLSLLRCCSLHCCLASLQFCARMLFLQGD